MKKVNQRLQRLVASDICQAENVERYREELMRLTEEIVGVGTMKRQSRLFKALSDEKRLTILRLLRVRAMCICELMIALDVTQPNISHHLRTLENEGIVNRTKKGKWVYCSLANRKLVEDMIKINLL